VVISIEKTAGNEMFHGGQRDENVIYNPGPIGEWDLRGIANRSRSYMYV